MGMSASQMRYTMLAGKKSDVEYQGQQINQQRTTLATESSSLNAQLMDITVPTPPSSDSFTKTTYTYDANGQDYTITGAPYKSTNYYLNAQGTAINGNNPDPNGVTYKAGTYLVSATTTHTVSQGQQTGLQLFNESNDGNGNITYRNGVGNVLTKVITDKNDPNYSSTDASNTALICQDCDIPATDKNGNATQFYKYTSGGTIYYITADDLSNNTPKGLQSSTYIVNPNATENENITLPGSSVTWDNDGRMTSLTDSTGKTYSLNVTTTSDDAAYKDAMNDYSYKKELYEQGLNDINAKISTIENEDKKLELKLQDLDTQQQALSTEMDSVKKVINKNIEASFKAFA